MNGATREYIEFFGLYEQVEKVLNEFFRMLEPSFDSDEIEYFRKLQASLDMSSLLERFGEGLESKFSIDEINDIVRLYRGNPVLMKVLHTRDEMMALQQEAGRNMVEEAAKRMPYLVKDGDC